MNKPLKGLMVWILQSKGLGNCSNGGLSSKVNKCILVGDGVPEIFEADDEAPAVKLVYRNICGGEYVHAEPIEPVKKGNVGYMAGGCYIETSDSRFP